MVPCRVTGIFSISHVQIADKDSVKYASTFSSRQSSIIDTDLHIFKKDVVKKGLVNTADKDRAGKGEDR